MKMIAAGVDVGTRFLKMCIVNDGRILSTFNCEMNRAFSKIYHESFSKVIEGAGLKKRDIKNMIATGYGAHLVKNASAAVGEHVCISMGFHSIDNQIRTIIDVGGFFIRVVHLNDKGIPVFNHVNEKCAAGSGKFIEMIAEAVEIPFDKISEFADKSQNVLTLTQSCAVFAESDVISQLNSGKSPNDIIASVVRSVASKVATIYNNSGGRDKTALAGGLANIPFFVSELEAVLKKRLFIPDMNPHFVSAYGAAMMALETVPRKRFLFF